MIKGLNIVEQEGAVLLKVRVQARATEDRIVGSHAGALKVRVKAPPVDNRANAQLLDFLARLLCLSRWDVSLVSGHRSRSKRVRVKGLSAIELTRRITQYMGQLQQSDPTNEAFG